MKIQVAAIVKGAVAYGIVQELLETEVDELVAGLQLEVSQAAGYFTLETPTGWVVVPVRNLLHLQVIRQAEETTGPWIVSEDMPGRLVEVVGDVPRIVLDATYNGEPVTQDEALGWLRDALNKAHAS